MNYLHTLRSIDDVVDLPIFADGWGPEPGLGLPEFSGTGFAYSHFDKKEKISKVADFTANAQHLASLPHHQKMVKTKHASLLNQDFVFEHQGDDGFTTVDNVKSKPKAKRNDAMANKGGKLVKKPEFNTTLNGLKKKKKRVIKIDRAPSINISHEWPIVADIDLSKIGHAFDNSKMAKLAAAVEVEDLGWYGHLDDYNDECEKRTSHKAGKPLEVHNKKFISKTTQDDDILTDLMADDEGDVFTTDAILSHLVASPRSVYSWDITVTKLRIGDRPKLYTVIDRRNDSLLEFLTVSENAPEQPSSTDVNDINNPSNLSQEASDINLSFRQMMCSKDPSKRITHEKPNPFIEEGETPEDIGSFAYRYRRFTIGTTRVVVRCEVHAKANKSASEQKKPDEYNKDKYGQPLTGKKLEYAKLSAEVKFVNCYAFNEWDSKLSGGLNWRTKMDQKSAVVSKEIMTNTCKVAKWTAQAFIAGADFIKMGFVSRNNTTSNKAHEVLGVDSYRTLNFAQQISLPPTQIYGVINMYLDMFARQPEGKFLLFKDPSKSVLKMFSVPEDIFDESSEDEDEAGDGELGEDGEEPKDYDM